jgi:peptidoglycan hydrolase-like protein with peptidoglycan-binding domain
MLAKRPPTTSGGSISASVGKGGKNNPADVTLVQNLLIKHGAGIKADGDCGPKTIAAIEAFQQAKLGFADGLISPGGKTWTALNAAPSSGGQTPPANGGQTPPANGNGQQPPKDAGLADLAKKFNLEVAVILAIQKVESGGNGYLPDGRPKILFEGHVFWNQLKKAGKNPEQFVKGNEDILYPKWDKSKYKGGAAEYPRLEKAMKIDRLAALKSASWGEYQIMGFNHAAAGYSDVESFVEAIKQKGNSNINALLGFLKTTGLLKYVQGTSKNWAAFAKGYNGPGYAQNKYDTKLAAAYESFKKQGY